VPGKNFLTEIFPAFLHPSWKMLGEYFKLEDYSILPLPFRFAILYQPVLLPYKTSYIKLLAK